MSVDLFLAFLWLPVSSLVAGGLVFWLATRPDKPQPPAE